MIGWYLSEFFSQYEKGTIDEIHSYIKENIHPDYTCNKDRLEHILGDLIHIQKIDYSLEEKKYSTRP